MPPYTQVTPAILSTVDYPGMCARFQWKAFGAQNGWGFGSARQAWEGQDNRHVGEAPPAGVDVPIWLSWDLNPDWHAAVMLSNGQVMTSPVSPFPNTPRQDRFPSIAAMIAAFPGNMRYLGWAESMDGTRVVKPAVNPFPVPPKPGPEEPTIGQFMAFRSVAIGYRPNEKEDRIITTALDFEDGQRLSEVAMTKDSAVEFFKKLTGGGFSILSEGHYKKVVGEFDAAVAEKREHELAVARASAGK